MKTEVSHEKLNFRIPVLVPPGESLLVRQMREQKPGDEMTPNSSTLTLQVRHVVVTLLHTVLQGPRE